MRADSNNKSMVTIRDIRRALKRLKNVVYKTPITYSYSLSELSGASVFLKLENLQRTGSFKIRGAYNKLQKLYGSTRKVIAASAGNHAQGVALAAKLLGMKASVVMPEGTPINKILAVKRHGAEVFLYGKTFDDAYNYAKQLGEESGDVFIHPFDDPDIIAGQGTIGLEVSESLKNVEVVFVPVGGGGLISGVAIAIKEMHPRARIIGVQSKSAPSMSLSIKKGTVVETISAHTLADGIAIKKVGVLTLEIAKKYVDDVLTVDDDEIEDALLLLTEKKRIVVEGAGAVGLAGLLKNKKKFHKKSVLIVVSGGNIDINILAKIIDRGLIKNGRFLRLVVELPDIPGSLGRLASLLGAVKANIVQIYHDRASSDLPIDRADVEISLETKSFEHQKEIIKLLRENGYLPVEKA
ncbi:MAG TPA: threonine ammonia-lyase [Thermodesulfobacteriota bacterium]|nr:threonine ammonia-lyase [Thermodesulfobacteriota bacterium]